MTKNILKYYEVLGLQLGASLNEVKGAYRDLVKVWHPDRFGHDPKLQVKTQEKLKEINHAFQKIQESLNNLHTCQQAAGTEEDKYTQSEESTQKHREQFKKSRPMARMVNIRDILLRSNFNYNIFAPAVKPATLRLSNYNSMPLELVTDNTGYVQNPFQENGKRFICFEALRRNIDFERLSDLLGLDDEEKSLTRRTYMQIKKCYFSST